MIGSMEAGLPNVPEAPEAYELAYREGERALSAQQAVVDGFRTRAGLIVSAAAITTSFFGGAVLDRGTTAFTWIAIALFVAVGATVIRILWPRGDWEFTIGPEKLIETYIEHPEPLPLPLIHRDLALHMDRSYFHNRGELLLLVRYFRVASVMLTLEVVAWVVDLVIQS